MNWNGYVWDNPDKSWAIWQPRENGTVRLTVCKKHLKRGSDVLEVELRAEDLRTAAQRFLEAAEELEARQQKKEEAKP